MNTRDIELPPLPKGDIAADTCPVMWVHSNEQLQAYAREAIEADRKRRGEPVAWVTADTVNGQTVNGKPRRIWWENNDGVGMPIYTAPQPAEPVHATLNLQPSSSMQPVATAFFTEKGEVAFTGIYDRTLKALEAVKTTRMGISSGSIDLYAAPQPPACNPSMQPELATQSPESNSHEFDGIKAEDDAEREALRDVYEAARGLLRYEGVDDGRAIIYRAKLNNAIEDVKQIDGGLWESPEAAPVQLPESISKVLEDCRARAIDYATCPSPYNHTRMDTAFQHLVHQVNQILATLSPAPPPPEAIQKSVQALVDAAILEGGSPPPSQEAAMQATEQRKADLLKLLGPFIGTPLNE